MGEVAVGLADAIAALRAELTSALRAGDGSDVRFELGAVELEFLVDVRRDASADLGVKFWVLSLEGKGGLSRNSQHRVKLTLQPIQDGAEKLQIGAAAAERPR